MKKLTTTIAAQSAIKGAANRKLIANYATTDYRYNSKTDSGSTYAVNKSAHNYEVRIDRKHTYGKESKTFHRVVILPCGNSRHTNLTPAIRRQRAQRLCSAMRTMGYDVKVQLVKRYYSDEHGESCVVGNFFRVD